MTIHEKQLIGAVIVEILQDECQNMKDAMDILMAVMLQAAVEMNIPRSKVLELVSENYELAVDINLEEDLALGVVSVDLGMAH